MTVGDLVSKRVYPAGSMSFILLGVVIKIDQRWIKVAWNRGYGIYWDDTEKVEILSASR